MIDFGVPLPDNLPLFTGISQEKRQAMLACLGARVRTVRKGEFLVPRTQLADYLCADRTAVARELAHMKDEGLIEIDQQRVTLY